MKIESGDMVIDSYSKLNFDSESGFSVRPDFSSEKKYLSSMMVFQFEQLWSMKTNAYCQKGRHS